MGAVSGGKRQGQRQGDASASVAPPPSLSSSSVLLTARIDDLTMECGSLRAELERFYGFEDRSVRG